MLFVLLFGDVMYVGYGDVDVLVVVVDDYIVVVFLELIMGESGVVVLFVGYFVVVCDIMVWCGVLLVFDEV